MILVQAQQSAACNATHTVEEGGWRAGCCARAISKGATILS